MQEHYDFVVIGGGAAGITAARFAAQLGVRVAVVERDRIGGDCTWYGCVPSKTLLKIARVAHQMRTAGRYGLQDVTPALDFSRVMARVRGVVEQIYKAESVETLRSAGIDVYLAPARFVSSHTVLAGESLLTAKRFLIATGARPVVPPVAGLEQVPFLTYETVWDLEVLPHRLLVVGGGAVGCEMAQAFQRLGAQVTLIEGLERILPEADPAVASVLARVLACEGMDVRVGMSVERVWQQADGIHLQAGGAEIVGDSLFLATGRAPRVEDLQLEEAGVDYTAAGIQVDEYLRASQPHIYAAGDCTGGAQFTHYAGWQAFMATRNALLPGKAAGVWEHIPWAVFTDPEVAHVGLQEAAARSRHGARVRVACWPLEQVDRAVIDGETAGFLKVVYLADGRLLGVTLVAERAGEMIHEWALALEEGLKLGDIAGLLHVYPTLAMGGMQLAAEVQIEQRLAGWSGRLVRGLVRRNR